MGFDGLLFGRADYEDKQQRKATRNMEMVWNASANLGNKFSIGRDGKVPLVTILIIIGQESWLFTSILLDGYHEPDHLCFDFVCTDDPVMVSSRYSSSLDLSRLCV